MLTEVYRNLYHFAMNRSKKAQRLLARMAAIKRMERGKLCAMAGRPHYNLQAWRGGRNEVRYVRQEELADLKEAIRGHELYWKLAQEYADEIVKQTRKDHQKRHPKKKPPRKRK